MVRLLLFVSVLLSCNNANAQIQSGLEYDVYFLAGQSNASGRGDATQIPAGSPLAAPQTDVQFYWHKTLNAANGNLTQDTFIPLQAGSGHGFNNPSGHSVEFGPELSIGRTLADLFPTRNALILKYGHGGSNLHTQWAAGGIYYNAFISTVNDALGDITAAGATYQLQGTVWVQGEADTSTTNAANYNANLTDLIGRIRDDIFAGANAPFVISRLSSNQYNSVTGNVGVVRTAQVQVANALANVEWVNSDDAAFSTYSNGMIHFDANGTTNLGNALGQQLGALINGQEPEPGPGQVYSISSSTGVGSNGAQPGPEPINPPTLTDNLDGTFSLAHGVGSTNTNAVFIDSSDGGSVSTALGRALTAADVVTVSGTVVSSDVNFNNNGIEFGLQSAAGFRAQPNMLLQIDDNGNRGGLGPFFGTPNPGTNANRTQTPGATEDSLNDGFTFVATYSATDIVYTVSDIITTNEMGAEPVAATTFSFSLTDAVAADAALQGTLDDYVANYSTLVGDSFAYFSTQRFGEALPEEIGTTISNFEIAVTTTGIVLLGDVNLDGTVDFLDISPFIAVLSGGTFQAEADCDQSGEVDFLDISPFIAILSSQ